MRWLFQRPQGMLASMPRCSTPVVPMSRIRVDPITGMTPRCTLALNRLQIPFNHNGADGQATAQALAEAIAQGKGASVAQAVAQASATGGSGATASASAFAQVRHADDRGAMLGIVCCLRGSLRG